MRESEASATSNVASNETTQPQAHQRQQLLSLSLIFRSSHFAGRVLYTPLRKVDTGAPRLFQPHVGLIPVNIPPTFHRPSILLDKFGERDQRIASI